MSATVSELIGQIIDPKPGVPSSTVPPAPAGAPAPLDVLIGRIVAPQFPATKR